MQTETITHLQASDTPRTDIAKISYTGQAPNLKMYREGYERFMNLLPRLGCCNDTFEDDLHQTNHVMQQLVKKLKRDGWIFTETVPQTGEFNRTIIAMEAPEQNGETLKEKAELVVAQWGDGHTSPVHGHASGFLYEEVLSGKLKVNTYRIVDLQNKIVRPHQTKIVTEGTLVSEFNAPDPQAIYKRQTLIHNFQSIGTSVSLHYLPEHTRDGRDNGFTVQHWSAEHKLKPWDVTRISSAQGMHLRTGEVVLVRSTNVPEYGDHFIVITGHPVMKEHGLRPQDEAILASELETAFLDKYESVMGLVLLKLNPAVRDSFLNFHAISVIEGNVIFPKI